MGFINYEHLGLGVLNSPPRSVVADQEGDEIIAHDAPVLGRVPGAADCAQPAVCDIALHGPLALPDDPGDVAGVEVPTRTDVPVPVGSAVFAPIHCSGAFDCARACAEASRSPGHPRPRYEDEDA